jgi:hypothetical protein
MVIVPLTRGTNQISALPKNTGAVSISPWSESKRTSPPIGLGETTAVR